MMTGMAEEEKTQQMQTSPEGAVGADGLTGAIAKPGLSDVSAGVKSSLSADDKAKADDELRFMRERNEAVAGTDRQINSVQAYLDSIGKPEDEETRRKREKRERSKRIIAAVSDGLSALGNLVFTTQYAPDMYKQSGSMSAATNASIEKARAERERQRDQYMNYSIKLGQLQNERARTVRDLEAQREARKIARDRANREEQEHRWKAALQPDKEREAKARGDKAVAEAVTAQAVADYAPRQQQAKLETEGARKKSQEASATASYAKARSAGGGNTKKHHFMGKEYVSEKDYHKDVRAAAVAYKKRHTTTEKLNQGNKTVWDSNYPEFEYDDKNSKPIPPEIYAGILEEGLRKEAAEKKAVEKKAPHVRKKTNNDITPPSIRK